MPDDNPTPTAPDRTWSQRCLLLVGSIGPLGHCPASGTVTVAVVGIPLVWLAAYCGLPVWAYAALTVALALAGVAIHQAGDRILAEKDSRKLVIDEVVGYAVAMLAITPTWPMLLLGFFLERVLDIAKVWPANWVERRWPGGWGVVGDDVVAGLYTLAAMHLLTLFLPS